MKILKVRKRWYSNGDYEKFDVLYLGTREIDGKKYILVREQKENIYSFGLERDFQSLYFFPVNQSCLTKELCIKQLKAFIDIAKKYDNVNKTMEIYQGMLNVLTED